MGNGHPQCIQRMAPNERCTVKVSKSVSSFCGKCNDKPATSSELISQNSIKRQAKLSSSSLSYSGSEAQSRAESRKVSSENPQPTAEHLAGGDGRSRCWSLASCRKNSIGALSSYGLPYSPDGCGNCVENELLKGATSAVPKTDSMENYKSAADKTTTEKIKKNILTRRVLTFHFSRGNNKTAAQNDSAGVERKSSMPSVIASTLVSQWKNSSLKKRGSNNTTTSCPSSVQQSTNDSSSCAQNGISDPGEGCAGELRPAMRGSSASTDDGDLISSDIPLRDYQLSEQSHEVLMQIIRCFPFQSPKTSPRTPQKKPFLSRTTSTDIPDSSKNNNVKTPLTPGPDFLAGHSPWSITKRFLHKHHPHLPHGSKNNSNSANNSAPVTPNGIDIIHSPLTSSPSTPTINTDASKAAEDINSIQPRGALGKLCQLVPTIHPTPAVLASATKTIGFEDAGKTGIFAWPTAKAKNGNTAGTTTPWSFDYLKKLKVRTGLSLICPCCGVPRAPATGAKAKTADIPSSPLALVDPVAESKGVNSLDFGGGDQFQRNVKAPCTEGGESLSIPPIGLSLLSESRRRPTRLSLGNHSWNPEEYPTPMSVLGEEDCIERAHTPLSLQNSSCSSTFGSEQNAPAGPISATTIMALLGTLDESNTFAQLMRNSLVQISVDTMAITALPLDCWLRERLKNWVQLSGHEGTIVPASNHTLWKKQPSANLAEAKAYTEIMQDPALRGLTPKFFKEIMHNNESFIEIQDLLSQFPNTSARSIMDIKMGQRTFLMSEVSNKTKRTDLYKKMVDIDPNEPTEEENADKAITKLRYMKFRERESSTATLGFRIEAAQLPGGKLQKCFKKVRTKDQVLDTLLQFFGTRQETIRQQLCERLKAMREGIENSSFFQAHEVVGSSILIIYDDTRCGAWMIDFAKSTRVPDDVHLDHRADKDSDGYLVGLDNLIEILDPDS
ncbi:inositol polyphosphate kinase domain-containing protein [Ditylenchus destructor]|uniref:Kinase n=1 Tax=Ditylenchus destructor TaxID=166010 RepID=A0AAD4RBS7_9BILA|nr:inositol polyphosphate kinase domain-containing protein [Ditylenchus destructor]